MTSQLIANFIFNLNTLSENTNLILKKNLPKLKCKLDNIENTLELNEFYSDFFDSVQLCAIRSIRKKQIVKFVWWTRELTTFRNRITAIYKKFKSAIRSNDSPWIIQSLKLTYNKIRAQYKLKINNAKENSWKQFCTSTIDKYGASFKIAFNKISRNAGLRLEFPLEPNLNYADKLEILVSQTFHTVSPGVPFPHYGMDEEHFNFTHKVLIFIFKRLKGGKAPGVDLLDFNIWRKFF